MCKVYFFALVLLAVSCTTDTAKIKGDSLSKQTEFVIDKQLSRDFYIDMEGYVPAEGMVPTANVAIKIAECVLVEIYGEDYIEQEKPFSVNLIDGIWIIEGSCTSPNDPFTYYGQSYVEIKKDTGEIIKLLHTK